MKGDTNMKAFFEEYGLAIVAIIVIAAIIAIAITTSTKGKTDMESAYTKFTNQANSAVDQNSSITGSTDVE